VLVLGACPFASAKSSSSSGTVHVQGYTRKDGTYVAPYERSAPNSTKSDNWSTKGNVNPYSGKEGTKSPDSATVSSSNIATTPTKPAVSSAPITNIASASAARPPPANLARVSVGMKKSQVLAAVGQPNIKVEGLWFYIDSGFVHFEGDAVSKIEAKKG
jgi:hypothetical protein